LLDQAKQMEIFTEMKELKLGITNNKKKKKKKKIQKKKKNKIK